MGRTVVAAAAPAEGSPACRLALGHSPLGGRAEHLLRLVASGDFDRAGLLVAHRGGIAVGAIAAQVLAGGTGVLMPPFAPDATTCNALVIAALDHFRRAGVVVAHCSLTATQQSLVAPLLHGGFRHLTQIHHMLRRGSAPPPPPASAGLTFAPYSDARESEFAETLRRTYTGSLDLPEATVDRPAQQLLVGYRYGQPDPPHWWLAEGDAGEPVGLVVLSELEAPGVWEVAYLGVVPERRGRGYGRSLLRFAIAEARRAGAEDLSLAIDGRNGPAFHLYTGHSFRVYESQELYLRRLEVPA